MSLRLDSCSVNQLQSASCYYSLSLLFSTYSNPCVSAMMLLIKSNWRVRFEETGVMLQNSDINIKLLTFCGIKRPIY